MPSTEQYFSLVSTSKSSWIAVPIYTSERTEAGPDYEQEAEAAALRGAVRASLFSPASTVRVAFWERYSRLAIAMIALAIFSVSVAAEVELLLHAGNFWR
jgi:hypothetical protein